MTEEYNRHHICYPRREHQTPTQRMYRGFGVVVTNVTLHDELHAILTPAPMPTKFEMVSTMMYSDSVKGLHRLEMMCYSFGNLAKRAEALDDHAGFVRCKAIERNYSGQLHILGSGQ